MEDIYIWTFDILIELDQFMQIDQVDVNGEVVFQDGDSIYADAILHCTGYNISKISRTLIFSVNIINYSYVPYIFF